MWQSAPGGCSSKRSSAEPAPCGCRSIRAPASRPSPASRLRFAPRLSSYQNPAGNRTVAFSLTVAATTAEATATLEVRGGATTGGSEPPTAGDEAESFADLLASLQNAGRNDELVATLSTGEPTAGTDTVLRRRLDDVVTGAITVPVHVQPASAPRQPRLRVAGHERGDVELRQRRLLLSSFAEDDTVARVLSNLVVIAMAAQDYRRVSRYGRRAAAAVRAADLGTASTL